MIVLVPGGLWEDVDAARFWTRTGVTDELAGRGQDVRLVDRLRRATSWPAEAAHLARQLPTEAVTVVAGSNGCSAAVRLAIDQPARVRRLVLAWPATAGDPDEDARTRARLVADGAAAHTVIALLDGGTLRGVTDAELAALAVPVAVVAAAPEDPAHQHRTVDALRATVPAATALSATPPPFHPAFADHVRTLVDEIATFASTGRGTPRTR